MSKYIADPLHNIASLVAMGHVTRKVYIAAMNMQFFCITVYVHRLIYSIKMIALPFSEEAWQGDKYFTYLLIKVSK